MRDADAKTHNSVVAPTNLHPHKDPSLKDVLVTLYNLAAVLMAFLLHKVPITTDVTVHKLNTNVVPMIRLQPKDLISRVVHVWKANMDVALMVSPLLKVTNSKAVKMLRNHHRSRVDYQKKQAHAVTSASNTSSTRPMELVPSSGTAAVKETEIVSKQNMIVRKPVRITQARKPASCQRALDLVLDTLPNGTLMRNVSDVKNSNTVAASAPIIVLTPRRNASRYVPSVKLHVSCVRHSVTNSM